MCGPLTRICSIGGPKNAVVNPQTLARAGNGRAALDDHVTALRELVA